jgi:signal transduction histidine kinase
VLKLSLIHFLLLISLLSIAQPQQVVINHYGTQQGFAAKEALSIQQSSKGVLYIGSNDGLVKYDSRQFVFFHHNAKDSNSISSNYCNKIMMDKRDHIWIMTNDDLDIFDSKTEQCKHVKVLFETKPNQSVRPKCFSYDSINDIMWVGTRQGLYYSKNGQLPLQHISSICNDSVLATENIATIVADKNNMLWLTHEKHLIELNTITGKTQYVTFPKVIDGIDNGADYGNIVCSYADANNTLWFGTWCYGLISYDVHNKKFNQYIFSKKTSQENTVPAIAQTNFEGEENILWLSTYGFGLTAFDTDKKTWRSFTAQNSITPNGISGPLFGLFFNNNMLWIGSQSGLHSYDKNRQLFKNISLESIANQKKMLPVSNMAIQKNASNQDQKIWFYVPYKDGYIYDVLTKKILPLPPKVQAILAQPTQMLDWLIDAQNMLWVSTIENGLICYNINSNKMMITPKTNFYKTWDWVTCFLPDAAHQRMWLGTYKGLFYFDEASKKVISVDGLNSFLTKNNYATAIMDVTQDANGNLWMTVDNSDTKNACIIKYNIAAQNINVMYDERKESLPNNPQIELRSIKFDGHQKIFTVFFTENIQWCNSTSVKSDWHVLESSNGLKSNFIDNMLVDSSGQIWFNHSFGISCYNPLQQLFTDFNLSDYGLSGINNPSILFSPNTNQLLIGQSNLMSYLNIPSTMFKANNSPIIIHSLKVGNTVMATNLQNGQQFVLNANQNMIEVNFALLSFSNADQNTYAWQLSGVNKDWIYSKTNYPSYTSLAPGSYTLALKAANSNAQWSEPIYLLIKIKAPIYARWWFVMGVLLLLAGVLWYMFNMRINRIKERFALRNKIASDLHDEIGSTLTSISILSEVSQKAMEQQPAQAKEMLAQISSQSKTIQQNMSDIVWSIRPDNDKLEDLVVRMREYATHTLEPNHIITSINADEHISIKSMDISFRKDVLLIYKEAINNIAKHANASIVNVSITNGQNQIQLRIADNGIWKGTNSGTGTKTMKERAASLKGTLQIIPSALGTEIILIMPIP